jgi:hypothetical protein
MEAFLAAVIEVDHHKVGMHFVENLSRLFSARSADDVIYAIEGI